jgi:hypothetical protein
METPRAISPEELDSRWQRWEPDLRIRTCTGWAVRRVETLLAADRWEPFDMMYGPNVRGRVEFTSTSGQRRRVYLAVTGVGVVDGRVLIHADRVRVHSRLLEAVAPLMVPEE